MRNLIYVITIIISMCFLTACSLFTNPKEQPVIEDKIGSFWGDNDKYKTGTLSMTPERRVVLVNLKDGKFCAEPPADVAENLISSFSATLEGSEGTLEAKAEIAKAFASSVKQLFQRSQGIQLYRDGMYSLCQAYLNGMIPSPEKFAEIQNNLLEKANGLIQAEIMQLSVNKVDPAMLPNLPSSKPK